VTGPLNKPVSEPVFIPSIFLKLLRPFHTLRTMLPEATTTSTNAPAPVKDSK